MLPYEILTRKRSGETLSPQEIQEIVAGAVSGRWHDAQLGAFLMAAAIRGLSWEETSVLTRAMVDSGERWDLSSDLPVLGDKHSTGGVGDKISLTLGPLLAACNIPMVMLTGRSLGHTGGTADKLESIPGIKLELSRETCLELLQSAGLAIGLATEAIAPADRILYRLRDLTATVDSLPLVVASIVSKKAATGARALVFDVKTGSGAFFPREEAAKELAQALVATTSSLGIASSAWLTDMSQPLGRWAGRSAEVREALEVLGGEGPPDIRELTLKLAEELASLLGVEISSRRFQDALAGGDARERFLRWAEGAGAETDWLAQPSFPLAPEELVVEAPRRGILAAVDTRALGLLVHEAGSREDPGVSLAYQVRLGDEVAEGQELARLYLQGDPEPFRNRLLACFDIRDQVAEPPPALLRQRVE